MEPNQKWWLFMSLVTFDGDRFDKMEQVAVLRMQGQTDTAIAKKLEIPRKMVKELFNEYKDVLVQDTESRDRAKDALNVMVEHYDHLIKESYEILNDLKGENFSHQVAAQMTAVVKNVADLEAKRLDAWQKAGLLDNSELGDELAEMEEKAQMLINILRNDLCPNCRKTVAEKLQKATNVVEAIVVYDEDDK
jgi:hypothetical protein